MGCKSVTLDLRFDTVMNVIADKNIPANAENMVKFTPPNVAGGHTLVIGDQTYTIGNGLTVQGDELVWIFVRTPFGTTAKITGYLQSTSLLATQFYKINLILHFK
jgi:hypothetical protein